MLLFRDEEHIGRWGQARGIDRGAELSLSQLWALARSWYADRLDPAWRRRTVQEAESAFGSLGLTGAFWRLT